MSYPKWLYHRTLEARIVPDESAHQALEGEWFESPADIPATPVAPVAIDDREVKPTPKPKKVK